jgi:hypothetical protein
MSSFGSEVDWNQFNCLREWQLSGVTETSDCRSQTLAEKQTDTSQTISKK